VLNTGSEDPRKHRDREPTPSTGCLGCVCDLCQVGAVLASATPCMIVLTPRLLRNPRRHPCRAREDDPRGLSLGLSIHAAPQDPRRSRLDYSNFCVMLCGRGLREAWRKGKGRCVVPGSIQGAGPGQRPSTISASSRLICEGTPSSGPKKADLVLCTKR